MVADESIAQLVDVALVPRDEHAECLPAAALGPANEFGVIGVVISVGSFVEPVHDLHSILLDRS